MVGITQSVDIWIILLPSFLPIDDSRSTTYLKRINEMDTNICLYCVVTDIPEYTFFAFPRWQWLRREIEIEAGQDIRVENTEETWTSSEEEDTGK